jgi:bacterioferritin-associated ferredoxin
MYVCICEGVTEREVRDEIAGGAHTAEAIGARCGAGTSCGTCLDRICDLLSASTHRRHGRMLAEQTG